MIVYELKEDWSSFKAGERFTTSSYDNLYKLVNDDGKLADGKLVLAKIQPDLLTVVDGGHAWRPSEDGSYHYIDSDGMVLNEEYYIKDDHTDKGRLAIGNCFKTAKEANDVRDWLKARQKLVESGAMFVNALDVDSDEVKHFEVYLDGDGMLLVSECYLRKNIVVEKSLCFSNRELAKQSIKEHKDDWLTYLGVKEKSDSNS